MKKYIGVKIVEAEPCEKDGKAGYTVVYPGGYQSWCPKKEFEEANRPFDGLTFGHAVEAMKRGFRVTRKGWNGRGMFLWLRKGTTLGRETSDDEMSEALYVEKGNIPVLPTICMFTATEQVLVGWLASQTDMLSEDWEVLE